MACPRPLRRGNASKNTQARLAPPPAASQPGELLRALARGWAGVVLTVSDTWPVPAIEVGFTKHADSVRLAGKSQVRLIGVVKLLATFTVTAAIAAEPSVAVAPDEDRAKSEILTGMAAETDSP